MNRRLSFAAAVIVALVMAGCASRRPAPVSDSQPPTPPPAVVEAPPPAPEPPPVEKPIPTYTVKRGDTLVSIALQFGLDYRELAAWNNIVNRNLLSVGQVLILAAPGGTTGAAVSSAPVATPLVSLGPPIEARPNGNSVNAKVEPRGQKLPFSERALAQLSAGDPAAPTPPAPVILPPTTPLVVPTPVVPPPVAEPPKSSGTDNEDVDWMWPVRGKVLENFTEANKGMAFAGRKGAPVLAAAAGRVIYANSGIRGYGKLVIIRHNDTWLSAYAHNEDILVEEQQEVRRGQKIATMGSSDADQVKLHFEVRRHGKPVDPAKVLPKM